MITSNFYSFLYGRTIVRLPIYMEELTLGTGLYGRTNVMSPIYIEGLT